MCGKWRRARYRVRTFCEAAQNFCTNKFTPRYTSIASITRCATLCLFKWAVFVLFSFLSVPKCIFTFQSLIVTRMQRVVKSASTIEILVTTSSYSPNTKLSSFQRVRMCGIPNSRTVNEIYGIRYSEVTCTNRKINPNWKFSCQLKTESRHLLYTKIA